MGHLESESSTLARIFELALGKQSGGVLIFSRQGKLLFANPSARHLLHLPSGETGRDWQSVFPREIMDAVRPLFSQPPQTTHIHTHLEMFTGQGEFHKVEVQAWLEKDSEENPLGVILNLADTTLLSNIENALQESERKLANLMANLPGMAYRCLNDSFWTMEFVSQGCETLTGYTPAELLHNTVVAYGDLIVEEDRNMVWHGVQKGVQHHRPFRLTYRIRTKEGSVKWVWEQGVGVYSPQGELIALEGFITDINDRKLAELALQESHERYMVILDNLNANIYVADMQTYEILFVNQHLREERDSNLIGQICYRVFRKLDSPCADCPVPFLLDQNGEPRGVVTWENYSPITMRWYQNHDQAIKWAEGKLVHIQVSTDITELKQTQERLEYLSAHDTLTGLYNRHYFEEEIQRLQRSRHYPVSIIMVDVDNMKLINDQYGHAAGDAMLKKTADVLRFVFRAEDVIARIGGDEFAVILPNADETIAQEAIQRIDNVLAEQAIKPGELAVSLSYGAATAYQTEQIQQCIHLADKRMYSHKAGKHTLPK